MTTRYAIVELPEHHAKAAGKDIGISTKQSVEICNHLRGMKLQRAKRILSDVMEKKAAIPFKRHTLDLGHKPGIGPGRYPYKASEAILSILNAVEANAQVKGLSTNDLYIHHLCANKASMPWRYGRQSRRKARRTHIEVVVVEKKGEAAEKRPRKGNRAVKAEGAAK